LNKKLEREILEKCNLDDQQLRSEAVEQITEDILLSYRDGIVDHVLDCMTSSLRIAMENDWSIEDLLDQLTDDDDDDDDDTNDAI